MMLSVVTSQVIPGNSGIVLMARIVGLSGEPITQSSLSGVQATVTDLTLEGQVVGSGAIGVVPMTVVGTIFNSLQLGGLWTKDSPLAPGVDGLTGYNFLAVIPGSNFANSGDQFQVDVRLTPVTGQSFAVPFQVQTGKVYG